MTKNKPLSISDALAFIIPILIIVGIVCYMTPEPREDELLELAKSGETIQTDSVSFIRFGEPILHEREMHRCTRCGMDSIYIATYINYNTDNVIKFDEEDIFCTHCMDFTDYEVYTDTVWLKPLY